MAGVRRSRVCSGSMTITVHYFLEKYFFKRKLLFFFKKKYMRGIGLGKKRLLLTARSVIVFVGPCGRPIAREKELG